MTALRANSKWRASRETVEHILFTTRDPLAVSLRADAGGARDRGARAGRCAARRAPSLAGTSIARHRVALVRRPRDTRGSRVVPVARDRGRAAGRGTGASVRA